MCVIIFHKERERGGEEERKIQKSISREKKIILNANLEETNTEREHVREDKIAR